MSLKTIFYLLISQFLVVALVFPTFSIAARTDKSLSPYQQKQRTRKIQTLDKQMITSPQEKTDTTTLGFEEVKVTFKELTPDLKAVNSILEEDDSALVFTVNGQEFIPKDMGDLYSNVSNLLNEVNSKDDIEIYTSPEALDRFKQYANSNLSKELMEKFRKHLENNYGKLNSQLAADMAAAMNDKAQQKMDQAAQRVNDIFEAASVDFLGILIGLVMVGSAMYAANSQCLDSECMEEQMAASGGPSETTKAFESGSKCLNTGNCGKFWPPYTPAIIGLMDDNEMKTGIMQLMLDLQSLEMQYMQLQVGEMMQKR